MTTPIDELHFEGAPDVASFPGPASERRLERQADLEGNAVLYPESVPVSFEAARGATLKDADGNLYLDFFAGIGVTNVGHCNPDVLDAVEAQNERITHALDFPTEVRLDLVEKLVSIAPGDMAGNAAVTFGGPTGSDAVEASIKLAKQFTGDRGLIAFRGSFHGETSGAFSLTADRKQKEAYTPLLPDVQHVQYPAPFYQNREPAAVVEAALDDLESVLGERYGGLPNPAGVWVEPIQGESGVVIPPEGFLQGVRELCDDYDIPLIADEVQTGFGRTGEWWASEHEGVTPDAITMGKAMGAGFPLSGIMYREELDTWGPGGHTGTFRGFASGMAAGLRAIEYVEEHDLLAHAREVGALIERRLREEVGDVAIVGEVRGRGMYLGVPFVDGEGAPAPETMDAVRTACYERGAAVWGGGRAGNVMRLIPPLVMTEAQAERGVELIADAVRAVAADAEDAN